MTPQEKAQELVDKYKIYVIGATNSIIEKSNARYCALIAVDEIRNDKFNEGVLSGYWYEVRQEIEKL